jgi:predicted MFS family arabinose efflux permease
VQGRVGFYLAWAGLGAAMAMVLYTPVFAVVTRRFPTDFRRAIITMTFLGGLASTVFIPLTAWLISAWGWRIAMEGLAGLHLLVCAPLHAWVLRQAPPRRERASPGATPLVNGLPQLLRGAPFFLVGVFVVLMTSVSSALPAHMISLLQETGLNATWVIAIPASIGAFQVLGRVLLYFFEHHFDLHLANRLIPGLIPLGLLALLASPWLGAWHTGLVVLFVVLFGMGNGMLTIVKGTAMAQYVSRDHSATLNGALGVPLALARAAAPLLLGWMWSEQSGYGPGLWLMFMAACAGIAALFGAQHHAALVHAGCEKSA